MVVVCVLAGFFFAFTGHGLTATLSILAALALYTAEHIAERNGL